MARIALQANGAAEPRAWLFKGPYDLCGHPGPRGSIASRTIKWCAICAGEFRQAIIKWKVSEAKRRKALPF